MPWITLLLAGACEVACTTLYRYTDGLSRPWPTVAFFGIGFLSLYLLNRAIAGIPLGTAYAVWTGIGAAGTVIVGIAVYGEPATAIRVLLLAGLVACIAGLKLFAPE